MKQQVFHKVKIEKAVSEGQCLAFAEGKTLFVSHAAPGDIADLRIYKKKKGNLYARITHLHEKGTDRIEPECKHFGTCGGCKWQHLTYDAQLALKANQVKENLEKIGKIELPVINPIKGANPIFDYRNKLEFGFSHQRYLLPEEMDTGVTFTEGVGFHVPGRFDKVLDITQCHLQGELSNRIRNFTREKALELEMPFYNLRNHEGLMRNLTLRSSTLGEWMAIVAFAKEDDRNAILLEALKNEFPEITSLLYVINQKKNDTIFDQEILTYHGKDYLTEKLGYLKFKVGPKSFFQTNTAQAENLYAIAKDFAGLSGDEHVYDLYTGTGSIALYLADQAKHVVGVEYVEQAIEDAKENAAFNGIDNVSFYAGDMKDVLNDEFLNREGQPDVIVTDPPRAGMHGDVITMLLRIGAPKIVYVSCNPATQARDLQLLDERYRVEKVQPVDMFPHTHHVENVVLLTLKA